MVRIGQKVKVDVSNKTGEHQWEKGVVIGEGFYNHWRIKFDKYSPYGMNVLAFPEIDKLGNTIIEVLGE